MHRKQHTDLILANTELEKTLRSLRKIKKAENSTMADERQEQNDEHREAVRRPPITDTMEDSGDQLFRMNTLRSDNLQLRPITLN